MLTIRKVLDEKPEIVVERLMKALKDHGFKSVAEVAVSEIVKSKLGKDMEFYKIFYICNPKDFYELSNEFYEVGSFAPCPVVVYEKEGKTTVVINVCDEMVSILEEPLSRAKKAVESL